MTHDEVQELIDAIDKVSPVLGHGCTTIRDRRRWERVGKEIINNIVPNYVVTAKGTYHLNREWVGDPGIKDDFGWEITDDTFIDGVTRDGRWAIMSLASHNDHGIGLGEGRGQMYRKVLGRWFKVT